MWKLQDRIRMALLQPGGKAVAGDSPWQHSPKDVDTEGRAQRGGKPPTRKNKKPVFWTDEEHGEFLVLMDRYNGGKANGLGFGVAKLLSAGLKNRSVSQVRSHAQKHFSALKKQEAEASSLALYTKTCLLIRIKSPLVNITLAVVVSDTLPAQFVAVVIVQTIYFQLQARGEAAFAASSRSQNNAESGPARRRKVAPAVRSLLRGWPVGIEWLPSSIWGLAREEPPMGSAWCLLPPSSLEERTSSHAQSAGWSGHSSKQPGAGWTERSCVFKDEL